MHHPNRRQTTVEHPRMMPLAQSAVDATAASVLLAMMRLYRAIPMHQQPLEMMQIMQPLRQHQ
jgi:hypothetical protein